MPISKRSTTIDIAKGICIVLVVFDHGELAVIYPKIDQAWALFRMPFFFFLSGIFFQETQGLLQEARKRFNFLLKPYFVTLLLVLIARAVIYPDTAVASELLGILYADSSTIRWTPLWFLPHLWLLHLVANVTFKVIHPLKQPLFVRIMVIGFLLSFGVFTINWMHDTRLLVPAFASPVRGLPFGLDLVILTSAFFVTGRLLRSTVVTFEPRITFCIIAIVTFTFISTTQNAHVNLAYRVFDSWICATFAAISGGYLTMTFAWLIEKVPPLSKMFRYLGSSSLFILVFHARIEESLYHAMNQFTAPGIELVEAIIAFFGCIALSLCIRQLVFQSAFLSMLYLPNQSIRLLDRKP